MGEAEPDFTIATAPHLRTQLVLDIRVACLNRRAPVPEWSNGWVSS